MSFSLYLYLYVCVLYTHSSFFLLVSASDFSLFCFFFFFYCLSLSLSSPSLSSSLGFHCVLFPLLRSYFYSKLSYLFFSPLLLYSVIYMCIGCTFASISFLASSLSLLLLSPTEEERERMGEGVWLRLPTLTCYIIIPLLYGIKLGVWFKRVFQPKPPCAFACDPVSAYFLLLSFLQEI